MKKRTQEEWLGIFKEIHKDKYNYKKMDINKKDEMGRVCIICPIHGEFWQTLDNHKKGKGCPKCKGEKISKSKKNTIDDFIEKGTHVHNGKYIYHKEKINYINSSTKIPIICPIHGEFWQTPANHLSGHGCPKCAHEELWNKRDRNTNDEIINSFKLKHNDKYDYSKTKYKNIHTKVCIICHEKDENGKEHGEFWQTPNNHMHGQGCPKCSHRSCKYSVDEVIELFRRKRGNEYDYSLIKDYKNNREKLPIICKKHGVFMQTLQEHVNGCGCPKCSQSHLEEATEKILNDLKIKNIHHCDRHYFNWLGAQHLDFYLPDYKIAIECQGIQHFKPIKFFGGQENFILTQKLDEEKRIKLSEHNIKLIYVNYNFNIEKISNVIANIKKEEFPQ